MHFNCALPRPSRCPPPTPSRAPTCRASAWPRCSWSSRSLPYILLGLALLLIFSSPFGKALKDIGLAVVFQPAGIVLAQLIVNLPFAIRMIKTAFLDVNPRMEFVAKTLGATPGAVFRTIVLPLCRNAIISTLVLTWARGWASSARRSCW